MRIECTRDFKMDLSAIQKNSKVTTIACGLLLAPPLAVLGGSIYLFEIYGN
jgi:hypothetical protein